MQENLNDQTFLNSVLIESFVLQFFTGWWIMIDAASIETFEPAYHTVGVVSSLAVVL